MIRNPEPPRSLPLRVAIIVIGASVVLAVVGIVFTANAAAGSRHNMARQVAALEAQVRAMCAATPDPATCRPVTEAPIILVVPVTTTETTVPFPPTTFPTPAANRPASAAQAPSPAPEPATTTTTAPPPPATTTTTCPTLPALGRCRPTPPSRGAARTELDWQALRACESGGDYSTNTGNGYYGAYQFTIGTWEGLGYDGLPSDAPPDLQDEAARLLYSQRGAQPWPTCGQRL